MKIRGRRLVAGLIAAAVPTAVVALLAEPAATGAGDPCAASEVARTVGSVSKSMGDYLDSHPETNQSMTSMLQQQAGPQSVSGVKSYFEAHPKVAADMTSIAQPLTNLSMQCKLPISLPQAMGLMQQAQGAAGGVPGGLPALPAAPAAGLGTLPGVTVQSPSAAAGALPGPSRQNNVG
jgi:heme-binding protein